MSKKKNLSIVINSLTSGGAEKVVSLLLTKLIDDYNVTLVLFYKELHFPIPKEVNTILFSQNLPSKGFFRKLIDIPIFAIKYYQILRKNKIDYAISFLAFPNLINGIMARLLPKTKTFISERGYQNYKTGGVISTKIAGIFYPLMYNWVDKLFSNSIYINEDLIENFRIKTKMEVLYNPIILPRQTIAPETLKSGLKKFRLITAGTLQLGKNHLLILKAMAKLKNDDYTFEILGSGPLKDDMVDYIEMLQLQKQVRLLGKVKDVNQFLVNSHCFVLSSKMEGFPNALLEALAIGLPSISTNCISGPLEMLNDNEPVLIDQGGFYKAKYGILINNDDEEGLAKALEFLKDNPEARYNYSILALKRAKEYELQNIYPHYKSFIES